MSRVIVPLSLPKKFDCQIEKEVKRGRFASKSEYIRDALRHVLDRAEVAAERKKHPKFYANVDFELTKGLQEIREGRFHGPFKTVDEGVRFVKSKGTRRRRIGKR